MVSSTQCFTEAGLYMLNIGHFLKLVILGKDLGCLGKAPTKERRRKRKAKRRGRSDQVYQIFDLRDGCCVFSEVPTAKIYFFFFSGLC